MSIHFKRLYTIGFCFALSSLDWSFCAAFPSSDVAYSSHSNCNSNANFNSSSLRKPTSSLSSPSPFSSSPSHFQAPVHTLSQSAAAKHIEMGNSKLKEEGESPNSAVKSSFDIIDEHLQREHSRLNEIIDGARKDVVVTGSNEEKRINEQADWERQQVIDYYQRTRHVQLNGLKGSPYAFENQKSDGSYFPLTNDWQLKSELIEIEERRKKALALAKEVVLRRSREQDNWLNSRSKSLRESAQNLSAQMNDKNSGFGLRKTGTNLYVRQYVSPHKELPPTRPGVARVVPPGTFQLEELERLEKLEALKQNK